MYTDVQLLYTFLHSAQGNWRNSIYVERRKCRPSEGTCSDDCLLVTGPSGNPILVPVSDITAMCKEAVDCEECLAVMSCEQVITFYHLWFLWNADTIHFCPRSVKTQSKND